MTATAGGNRGRREEIALDYLLAVRDPPLQLQRAGRTPRWVANKRFVSSRVKFKFARARHLEKIGLVLGCVEAKFCM